MDLSQNRCPICGGLSFVWDDEGIYNWNHVCKNNIRICGNGAFHTEEEAWRRFSNYGCSFYGIAAISRFLCSYNWFV